MFSCSASLRCPACREPLAPKGVEVGCGSCGQKYPVDLVTLARPNAALKGYAMLALLGCVGLLGVATWRQLELVERDCQLAATREQQARVLAELRACGERSRLAQLSRAKAEAAGRQSAGAPDSSAVTTEVASEADQEELRSDIRFLE
ncbi:MAG: hypothetical protein HY303_00300, partial [Candidatus Wallbacteria bacterium]|nr:hypothetical protein [Candidatus Wallbacteria bacterium]